MKYLNPLMILEVDDDRLRAGLDADFLRMEKRRLLAELELSGESAIVIGSHELDRTAILQLFTDLAQGDTLAYHLRVYQMPSLLDFLDSAALAWFYSGDVLQLAAQPEDFRVFIAPYYSHQFNKRFFHAFRQLDTAEIQVMTREPLMIPEAWHAAAWQDTYRHLHMHIREALDLADTLRTRPPGPELQELMDENWLALLNVLPPYFARAREGYAEALYAVAQAVQEAHQRAQLAALLLRQAARLDIPESLRERCLAQAQRLAPASGWESQTPLGRKQKSFPVRTLLLIAAGVAALAWWLFNM
ncbi:MAG: hypothetical protein SF053_12715 [Bacteroidia bacterium]|nr:hypothetical protein [Bacteroidia bacterium]